MAPDFKWNSWGQQLRWVWLLLLFTTGGCQDAPPPPVIRSPTTIKEPSGPLSQTPFTVTPATPRHSDYVGSQVCSECHQEIAQTYSKTTMANSAAIPSETAIIEHYPSDWITTTRGFRLCARQEGSEVVHVEQLQSLEGEVLSEQVERIAYEIGSGKRGRSYLIERDDQLMMSPLTWYSMALKWDVSPGYANNNLHFERPIITACVQCHVGRIAPVKSSLENRFAKPAFHEAGIGCERCHGPAGRHVEFHRHKQGEKKSPHPEMDPIINPSSLEPHLRESVCNECHLLGAERVLRVGMQDDDFRPGDPLHAVWVIFRKSEGGIGSGGTTEAVNQVQQMESSQCFQRSNGKFGCVSCHDPHQQPTENERPQFYRNKCLACHQDGERECSAPLDERTRKSPEDSCISCHMPSLSAIDVQHTSQTDHRVLRDPSAPAPVRESTPMQLIQGMDSLPEWEIQRARGMLMVQYSIDEKDPALATLASDILELLINQGLEDADTERALGDAYLLQNRMASAEQHFRKALELNPTHEQAKRSLSIALHDAGRDAEAEQLISNYLTTNQWDRTMLGRHIHVLGRLNRQAEAMQQAEKTIQKYPYDRLMRLWLSDACQAAGRVEEAQKHRAIADRLEPRTE